MIGYKTAKNGEIRVIITLEIPEDAITNLNRLNIIVKQTAKYRTNKAKVLKIEDEEGNTYQSAESSMYDKKKLTYKIDETIISEDFDMNLEEVCSTGIHFFLERKVAEMYNLPHIQNGLCEAWHDNGSKAVKILLENRVLNGLSQLWYENGQKKIECNYINGKKNGIYNGWYSNGQNAIEFTYKNDLKQGIYQDWYENGQKKNQGMYIDDIKEGPWKLWDKNGNIIEDQIYKNGELAVNSGAIYIKIPNLEENIARIRRGFSSLKFS